MSKPEDSNYICWIDLETNGNQAGNVIIEIGAVMTDRNLNELDYKQIVTHYPISVIGGLDPVVQEMHLKNGLWLDCEASETDVAAADDEMVKWIRQFTKGDHIPLAGSGVSHFDRKFITKDLPKLSDYLSYWSYDVGTMRRMLKLFNIEVQNADTRADGLNHRALDDIRAHIEEARVYKDMLRRAMMLDQMGWHGRVYRGIHEEARVELAGLAYLDSAGNPI